MSGKELLLLALLWASGFSMQMFLLQFSADLGGVTGHTRMLVASCKKRAQDFRDRKQ